MLMEYRAGEVLSLAVGFKCCWEANQGVEGSENAPEQLKAFCFSVRAQARNRDSPHMAGVGGKWSHVACLCLLQLRVRRGRPAPCGDGQAGEDGLLRAVDDGGGADAGVVPAQAVRRERRNARKDLMKL